jgi:hypothetical protein
MERINTGYLLTKPRNYAERVSTAARVRMVGSLARRERGREGKLQQNNISEISLSEFAAGIYNLIVYNSSENFNFKIIKQL